MYFNEEFDGVKLWASVLKRLTVLKANSSNISPWDYIMPLIFFVVLMMAEFF